MNRLISIIVPCYNQAQYMSEALESVLNQTYINWECIIVNDGSPDKTAIVAQEWIRKDSRFKYINKENGGLSSARNAGIEIARGEFILPLDADDFIGSEYIERAMLEFEKNDNLKLVYCEAEKFGEEQGKWHLPPFSIVDLVNWNMIFCSALFRKSDWKNVGGYDPQMIYGLEDWEFWIALLKKGGEVIVLDYVGFYYRIKKESMLKSINPEQQLHSEYMIRTKHIDFVEQNYLKLKDINKSLKENIIHLELGMTSEKVLINALFHKLFGFKIFKIK